MPRLKQSPEQAGNTVLMAEISRGMQIKNKPDRAARVYAGISDTAWYRRRDDPGSFKLSELRHLFDALKTDNETILHIFGRRGGTK